MNEKEQKLFDIKTHALRLGAHTRSVILIEIDHENSFTTTCWNDSAFDLSFMKEVISRITRNVVESTFKKS